MLRSILVGFQTLRPEERPRPRPLDESQNFLSLLNVLEVTSLPLKYTALVNNLITVKTVLTVS